MKEKPQIQFEGDLIKLVFHKHRTDLSLVQQYMDEYHPEVDDYINDLAKKLNITYDEAVKKIARE